jgi:hypothetical protein
LVQFIHNILRAFLLGFVRHRFGFGAQFIFELKLPRLNRISTLPVAALFFPKKISTFAAVLLLGESKGITAGGQENSFPLLYCGC